MEELKQIEAVSELTDEETRKVNGGIIGILIALCVPERGADGPAAYQTGFTF